MDPEASFSPVPSERELRDIKTKMETAQTGIQDHLLRVSERLKALEIQQEFMTRDVEKLDIKYHALKSSIEEQRSGDAAKRDTWWGRKFTATIMLAVAFLSVGAQITTALLVWYLNSR